MGIFSKATPVASGGGAGDGGLKFKSVELPELQQAQGDGAEEEQEDENPLGLDADTLAALQKLLQENAENERYAARKASKAARVTHFDLGSCVC